MAKKIIVLPIQYIEKAGLPKQTAKPEKKNRVQLIVSAATAIVAVLGIFLSYMTAKTNRDTTRSNRLALAVEHLRDESLAIRIGALIELNELRSEPVRKRRDPVQYVDAVHYVLSLFIQEHIEDEKYLCPSPERKYKLRPNEDVFVACEIASLIYEQSGFGVSLKNLQAEGLDMKAIQLPDADLSRAVFRGSHLGRARLEEADLNNAQMQGADLTGAHLQGAELLMANLEEAILSYANLQEADLQNAELPWAILAFTQLQDANLTNAQLQNANLTWAQLQGANLAGACLQGVWLEGADLREAYLGGADLRGAEKLTAGQLLEAEIDTTTLLDPGLQAEYDRLKAEQEDTR